MITGNPLSRKRLITKCRLFYSDSSLKSTNLKQIEVPQTYEEFLDEAEIVGIVLGDGHIMKNRAVRLRVSELDFCLHFADLIKKTYGINPSIDDKYYYNCFAHSTLLTERIIKLTANNKQIPEFVLKGDNKIKARFVRGFSDAEGSVDVIYHRRQIVITQLNTSLLEQIKELLLDIGIQSRVLRKKFDSGKLIISLLENLEKYHKLIGFSIGYKRKKLAEAVKYLKKCKAHDKQKYWIVLRHYLKSQKSLRGSAKEMKLCTETYRSWVYRLKMPCQVKKDIERGWVPQDYSDLREQYNFLPIVNP